MKNHINENKKQDEKPNHTRIQVIVSDSNLYNRQEAANILNMSKTDLQDLLDKNEIHYMVIQGNIYIDEYDLWDWMYKQNPIMIKNKNPQLDLFAN